MSSSEEDEEFDAEDMLEMEAVFGLRGDNASKKSEDQGDLSSELSEDEVESQIEQKVALVFLPFLCFLSFVSDFFFF
jgi:hypothetical protein